MSRVVKTYCNCCGNELTEGIGLNTCLFFTIITATKGRVDYDGIHGMREGVS